MEFLEDAAAGTFVLIDRHLRNHFLPHADIFLLNRPSRKHFPSFTSPGRAELLYCHTFAQGRKARRPQQLRLPGGCPFSGTVR
jgi:hypothetical protein